MAASLFTQGFRSVLIRAMRLGALMPVMLATACTTHSYMGISLVPGQASPELQDLAARAQGGDKQAQLDLGIRFEEGKGVPVDRGRAVRLYRQAASASGGTIWVYSPPVGNGTSGRVVPIERGPKHAGLPAARQRVMEIEEGRKPQ